MVSSDEEIRLEVKGEGHTFCNALQNFLLKDPTIEFSGYQIHDRRRFNIAGMQQGQMVSRRQCYFLDYDPKLACRPK